MMRFPFLLAFLLLEIPLGLSSSTSSSWIWMNGKRPHDFTTNISLEEDDHRPLVSELIADHKEGIEEMRRELKNDRYYDASKHDDLWLVRFLMNHDRDHEASIRAARKTLAFRAKHRLDEVDLRYYDDSMMEEKSPATRKFRKHCPADYFVSALPHPKLGVISFLNFKGVDEQGLVDDVSEEEWVETTLYSTEWSHQWNDYVTRTTGRLTKAVRLIDLTGSSIAVNREKFRRDGNAMNVLEECYPQSLDTIYGCNPPVWAKAGWKLVKLVLPKRIASKIDFISPRDNPKDKARLLKFIDEELLPERFGGKNSQWPPKMQLPEPRTTNFLVTMGQS